MTMTPEQAVYSAAFTQALAAVCGLGRTRPTFMHPIGDNLDLKIVVIYLTAIDAF